MQKQIESETAKVLEWNKKYKIGQAVIAPSLDGNGPRVTNTTSKAFLMKGKTAAVHCASLHEYFELDNLQVAGENPL
jgi:hypothetical protein